MSNRMRVLIVVVLLGVPVLWVGVRYGRMMRVAHARVNQGAQQVDTACGTIEAAVTGQGAPVLVIHGAAGGFDQGVMLAELMIGTEGYQVIAPSRFGYLGSPVPEDASLDAQADAYACLLDALGIDAPVAVLAFSAGGPSALQFALRHPERTAGLVMVSAISYTEPLDDPDRAGTEALINRLVGSDLLYWLGTQFARGQVAQLFGVSSAVQAGLTPLELQEIDDILASMLPMSRRLDGIMVDQTREVSRDLPLNQIGVPTLVLHARDDGLAVFANAEHTAASIPGAELVAFETGGHLLAGRYAAVQAQVNALLARVFEP